MLIKMGPDLFRVLELQHVTPGNLRGFVRAKMRNLRSQSLIDHRFRSEDIVDRATLPGPPAQLDVYVRRLGLRVDGSDCEFLRLEGNLRGERRPEAVQEGSDPVPES